MEHLIRPRLGLASTVLERVIQSPTLASLARDEATIAQHTTEYVNAINHEAKATWL